MARCDDDASSADIARGTMGSGRYFLLWFEHHDGEEEGEEEE